ncbi:MAG: hypothetical protein J7L14_02360 [Candidatus Diapherotrites archaeon]|nr:hypothetical protein [Candidatus Diapherotrites archaeon]
MPDPLPEEVVEKIRELRRKGWPYTKIAEELGITRKTAMKYGRDVEPEVVIGDDDEEVMPRNGDLISFVRRVVARGVNERDLLRELREWLKFPPKEREILRQMLEAINEIRDELEPNEPMEVYMDVVIRSAHSETPKGVLYIHEPLWKYEEGQHIKRVTVKVEKLK